MIQKSELVWDACSILNLMATREARDILNVLSISSYIVKQVHQNEVLYLRPLPEESPQGTLQTVPLQEIMDEGLLSEIELTSIEQESYVSFALEIDDGEARSLAVAKHRQWILVTDDRLAIRLAKSLSPEIPTWTTPEWIKAYSEQKELEKQKLAEILTKIEACAHYHPPKMHILNNWWNSIL